jgi:hypothetical protein
MLYLSKTKRLTNYKQLLYLSSIHRHQLCTYIFFCHAFRGHLYSKYTFVYDQVKTDVLIKQKMR